MFTDRRKLRVYVKCKSKTCKSNAELNKVPQRVSDAQASAAVLQGNDGSGIVSSTNGGSSVPPGSSSQSPGASGSAGPRLKTLVTSATPLSPTRFSRAAGGALAEEAAPAPAAAAANDPQDLAALISVLNAALADAVTMGRARGGGLQEQIADEDFVAAMGLYREAGARMGIYKARDFP